jgi:hypothetical protein
MKRNVVLGTILSTAFAISLGAQSSPSPQGASATAQEPVTVTGCLQAADKPGATGTSGTGSATGTSANASPTGQAASASGNAGQFILANAKIGAAAASPSPSATAGTSGATTPPASSSASPAPSAMGEKFVLVGASHNDKLREYVNSQVEITGRILGKGASATAAGSMAGASNSPATGMGAPASSMSETQRLQVTDVKQISKTCASAQ